jgi:hypothetical protein
LKRVFVVHDKGHDLTDARRFGELKIILDGKVNPFDMTSRLTDIRDGLKEAGPEDYILLSGYALLNVMAAGILMERFGQLNILLFDGLERNYRLRTLTKTQLTGGNHVG